MPQVRQPALAGQDKPMYAYRKTNTTIRHVKSWSALVIAQSQVEMS